MSLELTAEGERGAATRNGPNGSAEAASKYRLPKRQGERIRLGRHPESPDPKDPASVRDWLDRRPRPWAVDLFCGAGGLSLGLQEEGFTVVAAADSDPVAVETHAWNIQGLTWTGDLSDPSGFIDQLDEWGIEDVDLLAGGPPCQPFSSAGISKIGDLIRQGIRPAREERADVWRSFFSIVDRLKPRAVLFENVPDFARIQGGALLITLRDELRARGYDVHIRKLAAWKYRVPQHRNRLFVIAMAEHGDFEWPEQIGRPTNVGQAIRDLPVVPADCREEIQDYDGPPTSVLAKILRRRMGRGEAQVVRDHVTRAVRKDDAEIYRLLRPGDTYLDVPQHLRRYRSDIFKDKYLRMSFEGRSRTITAHIAKDGYWYIHPSEDRTLSIREAARIQTFPDRFRFAGHGSSRYRQIGNAVPPLLASAIASSVRTALQNGSSIDEQVREPATTQAPSFRSRLNRWFRLSRRDFPWRDRNLTPWQVLMVEMCLHRTRAEQVARIADEVIRLGRTPDACLDNRERMEPMLASLGLRWRSDKIFSAAEFVRDRLDGVVPDNWHGLVAIPGVGDYIASAVLCFAFERPSVLMDTNTRRIAKRIKGGGQKWPDWELRLSLSELSGPKGSDTPWNQALLDLGALTCRARRPRCGDCPVRGHCVTGMKSTG